jgi:hypothetical protein
MWELLKIYIVFNFIARKINQDTRKLVWILILIKKIKNKKAPE